jgi:hypothetical protein
MTTYTAYIEEDPETGELILPFPNGLLEEAGWKEGDTLVWTVHENGTLILSKKDTND